MTFIFLISIPSIVAFIAFAFPQRLRLVRGISILGSVLFFITAVVHAVWIFKIPAYHSVLEPWLLFDTLGALMTVVVGWVFMTAMVVSDHYLEEERTQGHSEISHLTRYYALAHLFALAMVVTLAADHMILMWVALEASTLATTLLVAHNGKRKSLEAAWKYIILCSTGLLVGLLGILIFSVAMSQGEGSVALQFSHFTFSGLPPQFDPLFLKIAFVLLLVGIGTKVGLVPVHNWLPDAHGETPAPISAVLSGVLLSVALIVLVRFKSIVDALLQSSSWTDHFFMVFAVLSVLYAALLMLNQKNYKRLLAYSSIEHMGLATFGFALGPVGVIASLLHIMGHAILKPLLFFASGEILHSYHTTAINEVHGLSSRLPKTSTAFLLGLLGLLAMPPSLLFLSELLLLTQGVRVSLTATILIALGLVVASYGLLRGFFTMTKSVHGAEDVTSKEGWNITHIVMLMQAALLIGLSVFALSPVGQTLLFAVVHSIIPSSL